MFLNKLFIFCNIGDLGLYDFMEYIIIIVWNLVLFKFWNLGLDFSVLSEGVLMKVIILFFCFKLIFWIFFVMVWLIFQVFFFLYLFFFVIELMKEFLFCFILLIMRIKEIGIFWFFWIGNLDIFMVVFVKYWISYLKLNICI